MAIAKRAYSNTLKSQLSSDRDVHRMAYGKREVEFPRQSVFGGTSNDDDYLSDPTSSRRFHVWRTPTDEFNTIDFAALEAERDLLWGEAYQRYLDMRQARPHGPLLLDLRDPEVIRERNQIAEGSRKRTVVEEIAEVIQDWLDRPVPACEAMVDEDGLAMHGYDDDQTPMVRNMVTAKEALDAHAHEPLLRAFRNAGTKVFGKALANLWGPGVKLRRHGSGPATWYVRTNDDRARWLPARGAEAEDTDIDDLLG